MKMALLVRLLLIVGCFMPATFIRTAFAAHPLVTDDAWTQGRGNFQFEALGEYIHDREPPGKKNGFLFGSILTYGLIDDLDLVVGAGLSSNRELDNRVTERAQGLTDTIIGAKWRFYEKKGLSLAVRPSVRLPTANHHKGLGTGKAGYIVSFIATKELKPWAIHANAIYERNENAVNERKDLWEATLASELSVGERLKLVANIGLGRNADKESRTLPAFVLGGAIYSLTKTLDADVGIKYGLSRPEDDFMVLTGLTFRF